MGLVAHLDGGTPGEARFCPAGGISLASAGSYLALSNVGWWAAPGYSRRKIAEKDWPRVEKLAPDAAAPQ